jgi:hypothetical protein
LQAPVAWRIAIFDHRQIARRVDRQFGPLPWSSSLVRLVGDHGHDPALQIDL